MDRSQSECKAQLRIFCLGKWPQLWDYPSMRLVCVFVSASLTSSKEDPGVKAWNIHEHNIYIWSIMPAQINVAITVFWRSVVMNMHLPTTKVQRSHSMSLTQCSLRYLWFTPYGFIDSKLELLYRGKQLGTDSWGLLNDISSHCILPLLVK